MQSDSQDNEPGSSTAAGSVPASPGHRAALSPQFSRKLGWALAACALLALAAATVWAVRVWQTDRAIANVGSSLARATAPAPRVVAPDGALAQRGTGTPEAPVPAESVPSTSAATDRLPPLILPGQPVPQAVLRDLPEWVAADLGPVQTSGASGDEIAVPAAPAPARERPSRRERVVATAAADRYGAVFARCPGPGESGAVECRRAVCAGAARKAAACAPYLE